MKRIASLLLAVAVIFALVPSPVSAEGVGSMLSAQLQLGADSSGHSTLVTTDKVTLSDSSPLDWAVLRTLNGHTLGTTVASVTDGSGQPLKFTTADSGNYMIVKVSSNTTRTYVINYTQHDVAEYMASQKDDEFVWPLISPKQTQDFQIVAATMQLSDAITPTFTKKLACSQDTKQCAITTDGKNIAVTASNIPAGQGLTISVGFTPGTFRGYQAAAGTNVMMIVTYFLIVVAVLLVAGLVVISKRRRG